ncbi:MAG: hypothetical protein JSW38_07170 [Dehalococcoidia bacterium]|nr:MAG: hypothetical protein JSW38_07170 [Dehalococcoidia bacterium]
MIDGGPDGGAVCRRLGDKLPYWDRTLELVILTHSDADHVTGLVEVLRRYEVRQVITNGMGGGSAVYEEWLREVEKRGIEHTVVCVGQRIMLADDIVLEVIHPEAELLEDTVSDINNNSVVSRVVFGDFSLLLTGDIFEEAERCLLDQSCSLGSVVLKVPHHGSGPSCCARFLNAVDPQVAVISVSADNEFGHPAPEVVERLEEAVGEDNLYITSKHGTIELITDGTRLWVRAEQ